MIDNTTKQVSENPMPFWQAGMALGSSSAIEMQESQGQAQLVNSQLLPADCPAESRQALEAAGVVFGATVEGDDMFRHATLPAGWQKVRTDHSMWSNLVDEQGRVRAKIFYKAAFYDRCANMYAVPRFSTETIYPEGDYDYSKPRQVRVTDAGNEIKVFGPGDSDDMHTEAREWLSAQYPEWKNPGAYWTDGK